MKPITDLSTNEVEILVAAKGANPAAFASKIAALAKMPARRNKYSGGADADPYTNFKLVHFMMQVVVPGITLQQVVMFYVLLKLARLLVSFDNFDDESAGDTIHDLSNYADILGGSLTLSSEGVDNANTSDQSR